MTASAPRCGSNSLRTRSRRRERGGIIPPLSLIEMEKVRVFVSEHCGPCQIVKDMVEKGQVSDEVELVDIESDEGFPYIKEFALSGVPSAYKGNEKCEIKIDQAANKLHIVCPQATTTEAPPSSDEGQESPH